MKKENLNEMTKGWFVGNFLPTLFKTKEVEVAVKKYNEGDFEDKHYHKIATEITVIVSGKVRMNGTVYNQDDIIVIEPFEVTDFFAITNTVTTVIKIPCANNDKYIAEIN